MGAVVRVAVAIILFYALVQVNDVSAQCVISPNLDSLTIADGLIRDVEFHCQCIDGNARWLFSNGSSAPTQNFNIPPAVLLLPGPFNDDDAGTYTCSPNNMLNDPSRDTITLSAGSPTDPVRICRIYSPSLTTNDEMIDIPSGTQNVILYCRCTRDANVTVGPATWYINGTQVNRTQASGNNPYSRDNVPAPLIIPSFTATHVGTYGCESFDSEPFGSERVTIDLALSLEPPTNVRATVLTSRSVEVTWTVSSSPDVTGYLISYTATAEYTSGGNATVNGRSTTNHTLSNLEENTLYTITVQATASNIRSGNSTAVLVTTYTDVPSSPPQNVMVTSVNPASLKVSWQLPSTINYNGPITGHVIQYTGGGTSEMRNVNNGIRHTISGLVAFVDYSVTVAVNTVNGTGSFSNPVVRRSGEDIPSEPQSLETVSVNSSFVTLQWSPPVNPNGIITQYSFQYNTTAVANTSNNVLVYTVNGLSPETVYVLQVRAYTSEGAGPPSIIPIITPPGPVSNVTVHNESITSSTLTLTWMEISLTSSIFSHYTVFYLPVRGPYCPIMASNRRKRQSAQSGELTMNFTGTTGTLTDLYGAVTYRIQVATVVILNGQEVIGDQSTANEVDTLEGVPTVPRNLNVIVLTNNDVMLTWIRPDPPNGLITEYNASYINTNSQDSNITTLQVDNDGGIILSVIWTNLTQGSYDFVVVAFTRIGPGEAAYLTQSITFKVSSDDGSDDDNGAVTALAILFAIAVIGLVISVLIIVFLVVKLKQSRYDVNQSNIRYSDVKQSRDNIIVDSTNKHIKPSEPEYEAIDIKQNIKPDSDVKMTVNPAYGCDVKMDANPAYQPTS